MRQSARLNSRSLQAAVAVLGLALALAATAFAQLASRPAEEWLKVLESEERIAGLKTAEVVASLKLKPGDVVADLGAGGGPFVVPFARAVPNGRVYAVDIDRNFFPHIEKRAKAAGVANVQTVLGQFTDPGLPASDLDLAFMHDVLHHVENRAAYLKSVAKYLKPGGRIAIIDYHPAQSPHKDDASLVITREQAAAWLADAGFKPAEDITMFSEKWFIVFTRSR
jgi:ubiquinone/menaquinone biosynthesis C-methylase UbiE